MSYKLTAKQAEITKKVSGPDKIPAPADPSLDSLPEGVFIGETPFF